MRPGDESQGQSDPLRAGEPVVFIDRKARRYLASLSPDLRFNLRGGFLSGADIIGRLPGTLLQSSKGEPVRVFRATLEEYVILMPRGATVIPPKDIGFIVQWADIFPGAIVVEAGIGSGAMTLGLLRAVGPAGRVISFEARQEFINLALKNIGSWREALEDRHEVRRGDVHEELGALSGVDRIVLDLPEPWQAIEGAAAALVSGGILVAYNPSVRQVDRLVQAIMDHPELKEPEVAEVLVRPWVADRIRLRPSLRMIGHSGFITRARRRSRDETRTGSDA